jgi:hypothetical protein
MKSIVTPYVHLLLALFILAAAVTPACAGGENCSMPCCRQKAKPVSHHPAAAPSKACCTHPADASSGIGTGCRFDQHNLALNFQERTHSAPVAEMLADSTWTEANGPVWPTPRFANLPEPLKAPIYLRIQILLI